MHTVTLTLELSTKLAKQVLDFIDNTSSESISEPTDTKLEKQDVVPSEQENDLVELEIDQEILDKSKRPKMPLFGRAPEDVEAIRTNKIVKDVTRDTKLKAKKEVAKEAEDEVAKIKEAATTTSSLQTSPAAPWKL